MGMEWIQERPLSPTIDVPLNGYLDPGLRIAGLPGSGCNLDAVPAAVAVEVMGPQGPVPGQVTFDAHRRVRWTPAEGFSPDTTYTVSWAATSYMLADLGCGDYEFGVVEGASIVATGSSVATGPPDPPDEVRFERVAGCSVEVLRVEWTHSDPYVTYRAWSDRAGQPYIREREGVASVTVDPANPSVCLHLAGTHTLTGQTTAVSACADELPVRRSCGGEEVGCSGSAPGPPWGMWLLLTSLVAVRCYARCHVTRPPTSDQRRRY